MSGLSVLAAPQTGGSIQFLDATDFRAHQFGAELRYERGFASGSRLVVGLETKRIQTPHVDGETSGAFRDGTVDVDRRPRYNSYSLFLQNEIPVGASGSWLAGKDLPPPQFPQYCDITVNYHVARSLGLGILSEPTLLEKLRESESAP